MIKLIGLMAILVFSYSVSAVTLKCTYRDIHIGKKDGRKAKFLGRILVKVGGDIKAGKGGKVWIQSDFLNGNLEKNTYTLYPSVRRNESKNRFAKFHTKKPNRQNIWQPNYVKLSIPKNVFNSKKFKAKGFPAFLGIFKAKSDLSKIDSSFDNIQPSNKDKEAFSKENEVSEEVQLWCQS